MHSYYLTIKVVLNRTGIDYFYYFNCISLSIDNDTIRLIRDNV